MASDDLRPLWGIVLVSRARARTNTITNTIHESSHQDAKVAKISTCNIKFSDSPVQPGAVDVNRLAGDVFVFVGH